MEAILEQEVITAVTLEEREHQALFHTYDRLTIGAVTHSEGSYIYTDKGKYLDLISGLGVNALGYSHPKIISAIEDQARRYLHLSNLYLQEPQISLAEKIKQQSGFAKVFFCNSGTEAVEGALKLARKYGSGIGKFEIIGLENAFHGRTFGALSVMDKPKYRNGFTPLVEGMHSVSADKLDMALSERTAAIILEVIQGEGGIRPISSEFVSLLHKLRDTYGCLIIADEIQSGIGRTGSFFAFEQYGLIPDIVVAAKALGGGLPLGAIIANDDVASAFTPGVHGTTFGGNALSCTAGNVVLDEIGNGLMQYVKEISEWLFAKLHALKAAYPDQISEIRGSGLMIGIEVKTDAKKIHQALLERGFITNVTAGNVLRLLPPLVITKNELSSFVNSLAELL
ncbi:MAG TPA: acetylornithine transaminase [Candidatus Kapabacteria bacterium]|nr:acetylornithine transaminase [Candidatus Kapabacteria bacterium]